MKRLLGRLGQNIIVCGHYGCGKTNVATGLALAIAAAGYRCTLLDLDIINPYFRAADAASMLKDAGVGCIVPKFANTNLDLPALSSEIYSVFAGRESDPGCRAVFDVGGSEGALVLGRYAPYIRRLGYSLVCVVNMYRPLTSSAPAAAVDLRDLEPLSGLEVTHIINNSNLGRETSPGLIEASLKYARDISRLTGAKLLCTTIHNKAFCDALSRKYSDMTFCTLPDSTRRLF